MPSLNNTGSFTSSHEIVLQGLSQWLNYPDTQSVPGGKVFYGVDSFAGTEKQWSEVPIIFVPPGRKVTHPDHKALSQDPAGTVEALGYRIVGRLNNVTITGSKVVADALISDPQAAELAKNKSLGLSSGFDAIINNSGRISGTIEPNHCLIFTKCGAAKTAHCGTGNDPKAVFNNTDDLYEEPDTSKMNDSQIKALEVKNKMTAAKKEIWDKTQEMIIARGKFDPKTGEYRDFLPSEIPEFNGRC